MRSGECRLMRSADIILASGRVHTMSHGYAPQQAVAIVGNRIAAVGDDVGIRSWKGPATQVIDLEGGAVIPGLVDSHIHFCACARRLSYIELAEVDSLGEVVRRVAERAERALPGEWLLGGGWNHNLWGLGRFPRRQDVDSASFRHPLVLRSKDGHVALANSLALKMAGIGAETPNPAGGEIERDAVSGEPTGILKENAEDLLSGVIPEMDREMLIGLMQRTMASAHSYGLTGIHNHEGRTELAAFQDLARRRQLELRVNCSIPASSLDAAIELGLQSGLGDDWLRIGGVKVFADGALGARTADMLAPYRGEPANSGIEVTSTDELRGLVGRAARAGIHSSIHAIGDRANRRALDALESSIQAGEGSGLRHRIEHVQLLDPVDMPRLAALGVVASMQPVHCTSDYEMADAHWGARSRYAYAWRRLLDAGTIVAFGSDAPVESLNPWLGIYAAVTRQRPGGDPPGGWYPGERLTLAEAITAFTLGAAVASGEEAPKGSISPGKLADLVVLSEDIFSLPVEELLSPGVRYTILDGSIVFSA